jgi:dihydrofolate reductase
VLAARHLIDEYLLMIFPVILGTGRRLFAGDTYAELDLVDATAAKSGVVIATYKARLP